MLHVVEGQHARKIHENRVGKIHVGRDARRQALQHAHGFIGKITDRAGGEGRQAGNYDRMVARAEVAQELEDVARPFLAVRSTRERDAVTAAGNDLKRVDAEERVAAHALAALNALEQKTVGVRSRRASVLRRETQERGDGTQQVRDHRPMNRHNIALAGQPFELCEIGKSVGHEMKSKFKELRSRKVEGSAFLTFSTSSTSSTGS